MSTKYKYNDLSSAAEVARRIRELEGLRFDSNVAELLGANAAAMSTYKKRGSIPIERLIKYAFESGYSLDYLLLGRGPVKVVEDEGEASAPASAVNIAAAVYTELQQAGSFLPSQKFVQVVRILREHMNANGLTEIPKDKLIETVHLAMQPVQIKFDLDLFAQCMADALPFLTEQRPDMSLKDQYRFVIRLYADQLERKHNIDRQYLENHLQAS